MNRFILFLFMSVLIVTGCSDSDEAVLYDQSTKSRLWAFYLMGTNYERTNGAISDYLDSMLESWQSLSDPDNIDCLIAIGGVDKDGWRGVKFMDLEMLSNDSSDGIYGNMSADAYYFTDIRADMGDKQTLKQFLTFVQNNSGTPAFSLFTMFDHGYVYGDRYAGIGPDDYTHNSLDLSAIRESLIETNSYFDMVSFDACLMGALESARVLEGRTKYMLASEEVMFVRPSLMWDQVVYHLAVDANIETFGKSMVDVATGIVDYPLGTHPTRSMVDVREVSTLSNSVDALGALLAEKLKSPVTGNAITLAYGLAQRFTENGYIGSRRWQSNDIKDFAHILYQLADDEAIRNAASDVVDNIESYVVYSQNNGTRPHAYGVSIAPLGMSAESAQYHYEQDWTTQGWTRLIAAYSELAGQYADVSQPQFSQSIQNVDYRTLGNILSGTGNGDLPDDGISVVAARIDSDYISDLESLIGIRTENNGFIIYQRQEAYLTDTGWVFAPEWDGDWLTISGGPGGEPFFVPVSQEAVQEGVAEYYEAHGQITTKSGETLYAIVLISYDLVTRQFTNNCVFFTDEGRWVAERPLGAGDRISFFENQIDTLTGEMTRSAGFTLNFNDDPAFQFAPANAQFETIIAAMHIGGKTGFTAIK